MRNIRIEKIADMVKEGMVVAGIGTDHALLPILLVERGKCKKVYACDISQGPLSAAKENIAKYDMSDFIQPVLSNGFEHVPEDSEVAVIAGMGHITACMILDNAMNRLSSFKQIITEINRNPEEMRKWISQHGYTIEDESFVSDRNHDYVIISFTTKHHEPYTEEEIELGPILMNEEDSEFYQYCVRMYEKLSLIDQRSKGKSLDIKKRLSFYDKYLKNHS